MFKVGTVKSSAIGGKQHRHSTQEHHTLVVFFNKVNKTRALARAVEISTGWF